MEMQDSECWPMRKVKWRSLVLIEIQNAENKKSRTKAGWCNYTWIFKIN